MHELCTNVERHLHQVFEAQLTLIAFVVPNSNRVSEKGQVFAGAEAAAQLARNALAS